MRDKALIEEANRALYELVYYVPRLLEALYYSNQREDNCAGSIETFARRCKELEEDAKLRELAEKMAGEEDA